MKKQIQTEDKTLKELINDLGRLSENLKKLSWALSIFADELEKDIKNEIR